MLDCWIDASPYPHPILDAVGHTKGAVRVIGVIDLAAGRAVHARAGARETYAPVRAVAGLPIGEGDALALARAYLDLGIDELYVADLDAILGGKPQDAVLAALAGLGAPLWLDAGVSSVDRAASALDLGARHLVVGLETLTSFEALEAICAAVEPGHVAFSLDLRDGRPIVTGDRIRLDEPHLMAARAAQAGAGTVIVIDLARVGTGAGLDLELIARVRQAVPGLLVAGGGVGEAGDLTHLANAGCDGALAGTALHNGRITATELSAVRRGAGR